MAVDMLEYDEETGRWYACEGGQYDPLNNRTTDLVGCYSCKTSYFEDIYPSTASRWRPSPPAPSSWTR